MICMVYERDLAGWDSRDLHGLLRGAIAKQDLWYTQKPMGYIYLFILTIFSPVYYGPL